MTDIEKFDRAVYAYLTDVSEKVVYAPTHNALKTITKREEFSDKKPWNFISYYRDPSFDIDWDRMSNSAALYGDFTKGVGIPDPKKMKATYVHNIPLNLSYDVEIWASKAIEVQELAVALISKIFMDDQVLIVPINPDGEDGRFHILNVSWSDNSDIERETEIGRIYRHTISFTIDARLTLTRTIECGRGVCDVAIDIYDN